MRTWCHANIIKCQVGDAGVKLEEKGQWLTNSSCGSEDSDFR
jgi:hypothetical protein